MVMKLVLEMLQSMDTVNCFVLFLFLEVLLVSYIKFKEKLPSNRRTNRGSIDHSWKQIRKTKETDWI